MPLPDQGDPICPNCRVRYAVGQAQPIGYSCTGACKDNGRAFMRISVEVLNEALCIPPGYSIVSNDKVLNLVIEGPDLPEPNADGTLKEMNPVITKTWKFELADTLHYDFKPTHRVKPTVETDRHFAVTPTGYIHSGGGKCGP